jgi:catechol 2,3-dioxygenase-like lactoylglutathione lyase family enzyme
MLSHVYIGVADLPRAYAFYAPLMETLGCALQFYEAEGRRTGWKPANAARPLFVIGLPFDDRPPAPGNGQMIALLAPSRAAVDACYAAAIANGGTCEGAPGLRPHYHSNYYGAYFRDPEGNKLCVCCHGPA